MSVYIVKEKGSSRRSFIATHGNFDAAVEILHTLERIDHASDCYVPDRYGIIERDYCPAHDFDCENNMMGICSLRYPEKECPRFMLLDSKDELPGQQTIQLYMEEK